jgi:hypothetical protein
MVWNFVTEFLSEVSRLVAAEQVVVTQKAAIEITDLDMGRDNVSAILLSLVPDDFLRTERGWLGDEIYTFTTPHDELDLWIRLTIDGECVVISFHEADNDDQK